jgi:bifunctional DNase/RNase
MEVAEVEVPLPQVHALVHLVEAEAPFRSLVIPVGLAEGAALAAARERIDAPRPSTHELFSQALARLNADVIAVRLVSEEQGVYAAELDLMTARGRELFDCRPSDAMVLALRQTVPSPILVDERLLEAR